MQLTLRQEQILAFIYHQADLPTKEIARKLGIREHTVRREIERFSLENIIRRQSFIDIYRLGYVQYELYLSLGAQKPSSVDRFLKFIISSERVAWVGQFSGEFQYVIAVCCRTPHELLEFISQVGRTVGVALTDRQMSIRLSYTEFPLKHFATRDFGPKRIHFGVPGDEVIDRLDHDILKALSHPDYAGNNALAARLKIPQSTCHARIQRLTKRGIIAGSTYVIDFSKVGLQAFTLLLKTRTHSKQLTEALIGYGEKHPAVAFVAEGIGAFDYKIGILLRLASDIVSTSQQISDVLGDQLVTCSCLTSFDYLKVARYPFETYLIQ